MEAAERELVAQRLLEPVPTGNFDLAHLRAIHRHLFQDVYAWAGEVRTVEITKGGSLFQPRRFIEIGMSDIHRRIVTAGHFRGIGPDGFAEGAGPVLGDINHVHPFREGNGRTQLQYLKQLAERAGHALDLTSIGRTAWLDASRRSNAGDHAAIARCIRRALRWPVRPPAAIVDGFRLMRPSLSTLCNRSMLRAASVAGRRRWRGTMPNCAQGARFRRF